MKIFSIFLTLFIFSAYSCKKKNNDSNNDHATNIAETVKDDDEENETRNKKAEDPLTANVDDLKNGISEYKKTDNYQNPKSEEDKAFNTMVDITDETEISDFKDLIDKNSFENSNNKIEELKQGEQTSQENAEENTEGEESSDGGVSDLTKGYGTYMLVVGSLLAIPALFNLSKGVANTIDGLKNWNKGALNLDAGVTLSRKKQTLIGAASAANAGIILSYLVVGSLLTAEDEPSEDTITTARVLLAASAAANVAKVGYTNSQLYGARGEKTFAELRKPLAGQNQMSDTDFKKAKRGARAGAGIGSVISLGISAALIYGSVEMGLTESQSSKDKTKLLKIYKTFFEKMRALEIQKKKQRTL